MDMIAFALLPLVFAVFNAYSRVEWEKLLFKHLFLLSFLILAGELWLAYSGSVLLAVMLSALFVWILVFAVDLVMLMPKVLGVFFKRMRK